VFGFGRISNWVPVDFFHARSGDGGLTLQIVVACPERKAARD